MGLPSLVIEFSKKASTAVERSSRGKVLLLLNDSTKTQIVTAYNNITEVNTTDWKAENLDYIDYAFMSKPAMVIAVRAVVSEGKVDVEKSLKLIDSLDFDYFAFPEMPEDKAQTVATFFSKAKKERYKKWKAVLANVEADSYAVINFTTSDIGIIDKKTNTVKQVTTSQYTARIAGVLAATSLEHSATYTVLDEVVDVKQSENPNADVDAGKLIIIFDGEKFKIARAVTSLKTITSDSLEDFKKIKIVEACDLIRADIIKTFEDRYVGKCNNSYTDKRLLIGAIMTYFRELEDVIIDKEEGYNIDLDIEEIKKYLVKKGVDTSNMKPIDLLKANTGSFVPLSGNLRILDAMEDMQLKITL